MIEPYSFTAPTVNPLTKYFWKNGYDTAIGNVAITTIAIFAASAGIVLNKVPISAKKYSENYYYGSTSMSNMQKSKARMKESTKNAELLKS